MCVSEQQQKWQRAIILVDMNAFFASIEQLDHPEWRGRPLAVTNGEQGSCIITCSYEARQFGIKTGMRLFEARKRCRHLVHAPSRPQRYVEVSARIMQALQAVTPEVETFSVDEAFLDVTNCQRLYHPIEAAKKVKKLVYDASGLHCSVGLSGDKTTAKYAAQLHKPNGFTVIEPQQAKEALRCVPVTALCGIGSGIAAFLARYGVVYCGDMQQLPIGILSKRFGHLGRRLWYMCQGADPEPVRTQVREAKSMGHGKVLPPATRDDKTLLSYFSYLCERLAMRLRGNHLSASVFFIGMKSMLWGWLSVKVQLLNDTDHALEIYKHCQQLLKKYPEHDVIRQVQVTALDPKSGYQQLDLFVQKQQLHKPINKVKDSINLLFGKQTLSSARQLQHHDMVAVISPAWRPQGTRNSIQRQ